MSYKQVLLLVLVCILTTIFITACAPVSPDNQPTVQDQILDAPLLYADYYIQNENEINLYKVVTFVDSFGRNCTTVLSVYTDAGPSLTCEYPPK